MSELEPDLRTEDDDWQAVLAADPEWGEWLDQMNQPTKGAEDEISRQITE